MFEFYTWGTNARLLITLFFAVCVLVQSTSLVFSRYRYPKTRLRVFESLLELAILLDILCLSLLYGQVYMGFDAGLAAPIAYGALRIAAFACVAGLALLVFVKGRVIWPLLPILSALVTLPSVEAASGRAYPYLYLLSLVFLLVRGGHLSFLRYREMKTGLSDFSIKEAIDNLHTGILFCREDGRVLLESRCMRRLIMEITGGAVRNGALFYEQFTSGYYDDTITRTELDDRAVCLFPDGAAWMFAKTKMTLKGRVYVQLTASDVTERYRLTAELKARDDALGQRSEELQRTIENLRNLSREREIQQAKMRAHDVLGQRLTVLLRMARGENALDIPLLKSQSEGLLRELSSRPDPPPPAKALLDLQRIFGSIGVDVRVTGELPEDDARARLFADAIKEGVANAVRHGFATVVEAHCVWENGRATLHIWDNGYPPARPFAEGGGIGGIRKKVTETGGSLAVSHTPRFALSITLPGGDV